MKKMYLFALLALTTLSYGQIIKNGGFEDFTYTANTALPTTTTFNWTRLNSTGACNVAIGSTGGAGSTLTKSGTKMIRSNANGTFYQNFTVTKNTEHTLSLSIFYNLTTTSSNSCTIEIGNSDGTPLTQPIKFSPFSAVTANGYTLYNFRFTSPDAAGADSSLRLTITNGISTLAFDDISITTGNASSLTATNTSVVFTGSSQTPVFTTTGLTTNVNVASTDIIFRQASADAGTIIAPTNANPYTAVARYDFSGSAYTNTRTNGIYGFFAQNFIIAKRTPTISTAPTASALNVGQTLANSTLSGGLVASISIPSGGGFAFTAPSTQPLAGTAQQSVTFTPTDLVNNNTATVSVNVTVNKFTPTLSITNTPQNFTGSSIVAVLSTNSDGAISNILYDGSSTVPSAAGTYVITADVAATATYNAGTGVAAGNFVINSKINPTINTPPTASAITFLQTLASSTLTGGAASVAGTFSFTNPSTAPAAGNNSQNITFTPDDTDLYNTVFSTVSVTVNKATPTITTSPTATGISYLQTLASSTLSGGAASVAGTFAFTSPTTVPNAGTASQGVTFSPADTTNYNTATGTVSVVVAKVTPVLSVRPTVAVLTQGDVMSSLVFTGGSASFSGQSVPGAFVPNAPTFVPPLGIQNRTVNFVPTDNINFNNFSINDFAITAKSNPTIAVTGTTTFFANGSAQGPDAVSVTFPTVFGVNGTPNVPANVSGTAVAGAVSFSYVGTGATTYAASATRPTAAGTYSVTATSAATNWYFTSTSTSFPFTILAGTTWSGSAWDAGVPTSSVNAIIAGDYSTSTAAITANNLTVNSGSTLTVNSGASVTVAGALVNNGSIVIANNANLIQTAAGADTNSGSGSVTVNRNGSTLKRLDYTLWSSPVAAQNLKGFSSLTVDPRFYTYNEGINKFSVVANPAGTAFTPGSSFFIRMPDVYPLGSGNQTPYYLGNITLDYPGVFTGTLNNGNISVTLVKSAGLDKGYQAVGNPYPSVIDAQTFVTANSANIESTLYFWRKTNAATGSSYATWTSGGATSTTATSGTPNGKIQVGQGFIVQAKSAATVASFFNNAMRDLAPLSTQFFKVKQQTQKDRLWLNLTGANDVFSQVLVAYIADASKGLDQYDGKYINDSDIALTTSISGDEYTIQGRPAFDATDVVALNFKTNATGTYTIAIDHVDGSFSNGQAIYLVDKTANVTTNLTEGAYIFTAAAGVDNTRFELTYQKTLKIDAPLFNENSVLVSRNNGTLNVKSSAVAINNVKVYDVQGRLVAERKNVKSNTASFSNLKANQVLIVKVTSENNAVVTKKVIN